MEKNIGIGSILVVAIGLIVGLVMLNQASNDVNTVTNTRSVVNLSATTGALNVPVTITGYQGVQGTYTIINSTNDNFANSNISLGSSSTNGQKVLVLTALNGNYTNKAVLITATLEPTGYITESSGRALASLIIILAALGLLVFALYPTLKEKFGF